MRLSSSGAFYTRVYEASGRVTGKPEKSYKRECQQKNLSVGSMPVLFSLGIQPNCLNVHSRSESGLIQAACPVSSPRMKRRYASSPLWFHFAVVAAPIVF
jgi:hypothetical protein